MAKVKKKARDMGYVKIGNVHSHPYPENEKVDADIILEISHPSDVDLKFARKFNDIIRGIIVVGKDEFYATRFHDQNDNDITLGAKHYYEGESN